MSGLGYAICDDRGYLVNVLQLIIDARDEIKVAISREQQRENPNEDRLKELEGRSGALKWILVTCFGYQRFSNAKFGRIECYEAINAFAREIRVTAKQRLEAGGWRVIHSIVDEDRDALADFARAIFDDVEIWLEHEAHYDWVAFVPQRESGRRHRENATGESASTGPGARLSRFTQPEDIAALVQFLASEKSGYITGQVLPVSGGQNL